MAPRIYEIKRRARRKLHNRLRVPALFYPEGLPTDAPQEIHVREHLKAVATGSFPGTDFGLATMQEFAPRLIFDLEEAAPKRKAVVVLREGVAYEIENVDPSDGDFQTAFVTRLPTVQIGGFEAPNVG